MTKIDFKDFADDNAFDKKSFRKAVQGTVKADGNLRNKYHAYGIFALHHFKAHGNTHYMNELVNLMSEQSPYRKLMFFWFKKHTHVKTTKHAKTEEIIFKTTPATDRDAMDMDTICDDSFWLVKGMPGKIDVSLPSLIRAAVKRHNATLSGENEKAKSVVQVTDSDMVKLEALIKSMEDHSVVLTLETTEEGVK